VRLSIRREVVTTSHVREVGIRDGEVGGEHGGSDFVAVGAVTDE
jgi:hypothetical protein